MIRADDVQSASFTQTQLSQGYDEREVDELLDRVVGALRHHEQGAPGPAGLTASDARDVRFTPTSLRRGYDMADVDTLLEGVIATLARYEGVEPPPDPQADRVVEPSRRPPAPSTAVPTSAVEPRPSLGARILRVLRGDPR